MTAPTLQRRHAQHDRDPMEYDFAFWCVAHDSDYEPKYLDGGVCHDGYSDGFCHPDCHLCPKPCPLCPDEWPQEPGQ